LLLTLGITRIIEQESLDVSIWGSANNAEWGAKPLLSFSAKILLRHLPASTGFERSIAT